jgi:RHS repeat-associated protein
MTRDGSDVVTNQYTYGNYLDEVWTLDDRRSGGTVASLNDNTGNQRHFYSSNLLYHVYGLTTEGSSSTPGMLKEAYQYDAYGRQTVITDGNDGDAIVNFSANDVRTAGGTSIVNGNPYMYTGERFDGETGMFYFKNRYYSNEFGRFLGRDPIGYDGGSLGLFQYASSRPVSEMDSLGLMASTGSSTSCQSKRCCCCVISVKIAWQADIGKMEGTMGHEFKVLIDFKWVDSDPSNAGPCELEWNEHSNLQFPQPWKGLGAKKGQWNNLYPMQPNHPSFADWNAAMGKECTQPGLPVAIPDFPKSSYVFGSRDLYWDIVVKSKKDCPCDKVSEHDTALQELHWNKRDATKQKFTRPAPPATLPPPNPPNK